MWRRLVAWGVAVCAALVAPVAMADQCRPVGERSPIDRLIWRASLEPNSVRLTFTGHATFFIESPKGVTIATDYNDYIRPAEVPRIATMNRAHSTHFTNNPDPRIEHVLRGWAEQPGQQAMHDIFVDDVRVRNVSTDLRSFGAEFGAFGNSIFMFEIAGVCIAHLGHLHHRLEKVHFRELGAVDVVLVPVDGGYTMSLDGMLAVIESMRPMVVIPMHWFSRSRLEQFLTMAGTRYPVERSDTSTVTFSRATLPRETTVLALPEQKSRSFGMD
jgi:L-ascorbate metabolism protein UlaG (beta-lactamase superfamily)